MKKINTFLFCFLSAMCSLGQSNVTPSQIELSQKVPSSPSAGSLSKYFEVPVNMANGIPNIQIPIYTIESGNIKLPISLSYHAGGIKIDDDANWTGMCWSLNCENSITKRVNGFDDLYTEDMGSNNAPQFNYINPNYPAYFLLTGLNSITDIVNQRWNRGQDTINAFWGRIASGFADGEADEYIFSTPNGSITAYYDQNSGSYVCNKPGWLVYFSGANYGWYLTDKNGLTYSFEALENALNPIWNKPNYSPTQQYLPSSWKLTKIYDPISDKKITFSYEHYFQNRIYKGYSGYRDYTKYPYGNIFYGQADFGDDIIREGDELALTKITFENGCIDFIKDTGRKDGLIPSLKEIRVSNSDNELLQKFSFSYFYPKGLYAGDTSSRIFLAAIKQTIFKNNGDSTTFPSYRFDYDTAIHLPPKYANAQDYWGFYNGKNANTSLFPTIPALTTMGVPIQSNREVDTNYTKAGILSKITYPTGGALNFEFENNININNVLKGGLRIKRITNYDSVAQKSITKEYSYKGGQTLYDPTFYYFYNNQTWQVTDFKVRLYNSPRLPLFPNAGSPIVYDTVIEKNTSGEGELIKKHFFTNFFSHMPETYDEGIGVPQPKIPISTDFIGLEYKTEIFKQTDANNFVVIQTDSTNFSSVADSSRLVWNVQAAWVSPQGGSHWMVFPGNDPFNMGPHGIPIWGATNQHLYSFIPEAPIETSKYTRIIDGNSRLETKSFYDYDSTTLNPRITRTVNSKGDTLIKIIKYLNDFKSTNAASGMNAQIDYMLIHHALSSPVEIINAILKKDSTTIWLQNAELYEYLNMKPNKVFRIYDPMPLSSFNQAYNDENGFYKDSHYSLYQEITAFDSRRNPLNVLTFESKQSYIWDSSYLVASTQNALNEETAYTSFETSQKGNWVYSESGILNASAITGKKIFQLSNGNITRSGLPLNTYIISYWGKAGSSDVNNTSPVRTGRTIGDWTYYEHEVTGNSITVSGSNYIDELRSYPKGAMMITYTHKPLIGITSRCDANNRIEYYDYDGQARLTLIRDQDNNILKKICYNYAGQPEDCLLQTNNAPQWRTTGNTRCQLCTANPGYNSGVAEKEEKDMNPDSPTAGSIRWVADPSNSCPSPADWQEISRTCNTQPIAPFELTGYQTITKSDKNPCSATYNQIQTSSVYDPNTCLVCIPNCPMLPSPNQDVRDPSFKCINGVCVKGEWSVLRVTKLTKTTYKCTWVWCFPDHTFSSYSQTTTSSSPCTITCY